MARTVEEVVGYYVKTRDKLKAMQAQHSEDEAELKLALEKMEKWLLAQSNAQGVDSFNTPAGTAYKKKTERVNVVDRTAFFDYAIKNDMLDLINTGANKTNVIQHLADEGELPPGVGFSSFYTINVNRPRSK